MIHSQQVAVRALCLGILVLALCASAGSAFAGPMQEKCLRELANYEPDATKDKTNYLLPGPDNQRARQLLCRAVEAAPQDAAAALDLLQQAARISLLPHDRRVILHEMGRIHLARKQLDLAYDSFFNAQQQAQAIGDVRGLMDSAAYIAEIQIQRGEADTAIPKLRSIIKVLGTDMTRGMSYPPDKLLDRLVDALIQRKEYGRALDTVRHHLARMRQMQGGRYDATADWLRTARIYASARDFARSEQYLKKALEAARAAGRRNEIGDILYLLGQLLQSQGRGGEAREYFTLAADYATRTGNGARAEEIRAHIK